jgi:hypothetical protein
LNLESTTEVIVSGMQYMIWKMRSKRNRKE